MADICNFLAPDGKKSILAQALQQNYGPDKALQMWTFARGNMDKFNSFDEHGEPKYEDMVNEFPALHNASLSNNASGIYAQLGTKTKSAHVEIHPYNMLQGAQSAVLPAGVVSTRLSLEHHFGNPFSSDEKVLAKNPGLIKTSSTRESVEKYIDWVLNSKEPRAEWIRQQLQSGKLRGKPILYYKELGEPSHATALDYLINQYNWKEAAAPTQTATTATVASQYTKEVMPVIGSDMDFKTRERVGREELVTNIKKMYEQALANPATHYKPPYRVANITRELRIGYTPIELAWMIAEAGPQPANVSWDATLQKLINGLPVNYAKEFNIEDQDFRVLQNRDGKFQQQQRNELFVPILNEKGEQTGNLSAYKQDEAVKSVLRAVYVQHSKNNKINPYEGLFRVLKGFHDYVVRNKDAKGLTPENAQKLQDYLDVVRSFSFNPEFGRESIASLVLQKFEEYGMTVKNKEAALKALEADKNALIAAGQTTEYMELQMTEGKSEDEDPLDYDAEELSFVLEAGRTLRDYNDMVFELDPRDTASWRVKMLISTLQEAKWVTKTRQIPEAEALAQARLENPHIISVPAVNGFVTKTWKEAEPQKNYLGVGTLVDFHDTYDKLLGLLANTPPDFEKYMQILEDNVSSNPEFQELIDRLRGSKDGKIPAVDESVRNEFLKVMTTSNQKYLMMTYKSVASADGSTSWVLNPFEANRGSRVQIITESWQQAQKTSSLVVLDHGERVLDRDRVKRRLLPRVELFNLLYTLPLPGSNAEKAEWKLKPQQKAERDAKRARAQELVDLFNEGKAEDQKVSLAEYQHNRTGYVKWLVKSTLAVNGIQFTNEMVEDLFENTDRYTSKTALQGETPLGIMTNLINALAGITQSDGLASSETDEGTISGLKVNNPFHTGNPAVRILARVAANHTPGLSSMSHRSVEGKTIFDHVLPTVLSQKFDALKAYTAPLVEEENAPELPYMKRHNWLLQSNGEFRRDSSFREPELYMLDGMRKETNQKGKTRADMSDREQMLMTIGMFQNMNRSTAHYVSLTHSDKTTTPVFYNFPKLNTGGNDISVETRVAVFNVFKTEYERIRDHQDQTFEHKSYDLGKHLFFQLPQFNYEYLQGLVNRGGTINGNPVTQAQVDALWLGKGDDRQIANNLNDVAKGLVSVLITKHINDLTRLTLNQWKEAGLISREDNKYPFDKYYTESKLKQDFGFIYDYKTKTWSLNGAQLDNGQVFDAITKAAARDYAVNYFLVNTAMTQLVFGDPAQLTKAKDAQIEEGRIKPGQVMAVIDSTMIEYAKRLAKDIAPGQSFAWEKKTYEALTLADVNTIEDYLHSEELRKAYGKVDATDAQEVTTVQEHLDVMYHSGVIQKDVYNAMSKIVKDAKGGWYEFKAPEHLAVVMQPMKPVYTGTRPSDRGVEFYDYIKSSSYPLYPPLTKNKPIDQLRKAMEKGGIARANFASAKKIGMPLNPVQAFNADGTFNEAILTNGSWHAATQTLSRDNFRIQQEVPYDETKEAIKTITQMNKLFVDSIENVDGKFNVRNMGSMTGKELRAAKENIRKKLINRNLQEFYKENGIVRTDDGVQIRNKKAVLNQIEREARKRGFSKNELAALLYYTEPTLREDGSVDVEAVLQIPLMFATGSEKFESLLMSTIKGLAQVKMVGKSYVQAASVGFVQRKDMKTEADLTEEQRNGMVYVDGYDPSKPLRLMQKVEGGETIPAQVFAPFNFFITDEKGNKTKANIKDYLKPGTNTLNVDKVPKELLQLVGARIPNQGHSSMMAIEIVGFIPDNMGDLMIVPSGITKQMGADFDVDKLYTYKREYKHNDGKFITEDFSAEDSDWNRRAAKIEVLRDWEGMEGTDDELADVQEDAEMAEGIDYHYNQKAPKESDEQLRNQYFELHWSVLTNEHMYDRVLQPLDKPDMEEESKLLAPKTGRINNYFHIGTQLAAFQSGKHAKMLVALTSLTSTFNAVIQNKDLYLGYESPKTGPVREYIVVHDDKGNKLELTNLSGYGTSEYKGQKRTKGDNIATVQSAAVDNAKSGILNNLNLTPDTYKAVAALLMLETEGKQALNLTYITRMLVNPIIREFSRKMASGNDGLSDRFTPNMKDAILTELAAKQYEKWQESNPSADSEAYGQALKDFVLNPDTMKAEAENPTTIGQAAILNLFTDAERIGSRLSELQSLFNQETNGAGQNLLTALDKRDKSSKLGLSSTGILNETQIRYKDRVTEQGNTFDATVGTATDVVSKFFPYDKLKSTMDRVLRETLKESITPDTQKQVLRGLRSYMYATTEHLWPDPSGERFRLMYNINGTSLAQRVQRAKDSWGKNNPFLGAITPVIKDIGIGPDFLNYRAADQEESTQNLHTLAFMELLNSEDREQKLLGEDLVRYAYLTGGQRDLNSFVHIVPTSYLVDTTFTAELREAERNLETHAGSVGFWIQLFQHNPQLAVQIDRNVFEHAVTEEQPYPETFKVGEVEVEEKDPHSWLKTLDEDGMPKYVDFLHFRDGKDGSILYIRRGSDTYVRIDTLGNSASDEYNGQVNFGVRSIFQENRSLADNITSISERQRLENEVDKLTQGMEHPNPYVNFGIPEAGGGEEVVPKALDGIQKDTRVNTALRTVAEIMNNQQRAVTDMAHLSLVAKLPSLSIGFQEVEGIDGNYESMKRNLTLNPKVKSRNKAAETFLHELLHDRTSMLVILTGYDSRPLEDSRISAEAKAHIQEAIDRFKAAHPEVLATVRNIDQLRYEAREALKRKLGNDRFAEIEADVNSGKATSADHGLVYALSNTHEFIAHVLTNKETMEFLNDTPTSVPGVSFLDKIMDLLSRLITAITEGFGIKVNKESILHEALKQTLALTENNTSAPTDVNSAILNNQSLSFKTERAAEEMKQTLESNYNKKVTLHNSGLNHQLVINNKKQAVVVNDIPAEIGRVIQELKAQWKSLEEVQDRLHKNNPEERQTKQSIRTKQAEITRQIQVLATKKDLKQVAATGREQMDWVREILNKTSPTPQEIMVAFNTLDTWGEAIKTIYGGTSDEVQVDPEVAVLVADVSKLREGLAAQKAMAAYIQLADRTFHMKLTESDFKDITDINTLNKYFVNASQQQRKVLAVMAADGMLAKQMAKEDVRKTAVRLGKLEKKLAAMGVKSHKEKVAFFKQFMQENEDHTAWGLVQRYSPEWFAHIQKLKNDRDYKLESIMSGTPEGDKKLRKSAHRAYWKDLNRSADFIDTRVFFDAKTGKFLNGEAQSKEIERLVKTLGSREHVDELLKAAKAKYEQYLNDRLAQFDYIEAITRLTDEEKAGIILTEDEEKLTPAEQEKIREQKEKELLASKIKEKRRNWVEHNSPNAFFNARYDNSIADGFGSDKYVTMAPRVSTKAYYDEKYSKIYEGSTEGHKTAKAQVFEEILAIRDELMDNLPEHIRERLDKNFLPAMTKQVVSSMLGELARFRPSVIRETGFQALTVSAWEKEHDHPAGKIPIKYVDQTNVNNLDSDQAARRAAELEERSIDLPDVLDIFSRMVYHYKHMSRVIDTVNIGETLLRDVNKERLAKPTSKPIPNVLESIEYWKQSLIFQDSKKAEAVLNEPLYSSSVKEHRKVVTEIRELTAELKALQETFADRELTAEEAKRQDEIEKRLSEIAHSSRYFAGSKVADRMVTYTQVKALGYNPFAAVTNLSFALMSTFVYGNGRMDYTNKDVRAAMSIATHAQKNFATMGRMNDPVAQKFRNVVERSDILSELNDSEYGESNITDRRHSGVKKALKPLNWQLSGDFYSKGVLLVAMMKHKMVSYTEDGVEKKISLWDATGTNGYWDAEKYGERPEWGSDDVSEQKEWLAFQGKVKRVIQIVHGNQDKNTPILGKKFMLVRIFGQFRTSWLPAGIQARFGGAGEDPFLGREVKGRWVTYADLGFITSMKLLARQTLSALPGSKLNAFDGVTYRKGPQVGEALSDVDIENMRRNLAGLAFTAATLAALLAVKIMWPDDDEKRRRRRMGLPSNPWGLTLAYNMLIRNYQDLSMYASTTTAASVFGTPAPIIATINDFGKLTNSTLKLLGDDPKKYDKELKNFLKAFPYLNNVNKWRYMTTSDLASGRQ